MRSGYVNLKTDWGFKHLMGEKPQMLSFFKQSAERRLWRN
jgi:hypothetical protein